MDTKKDGFEEGPSSGASMLIFFHYFLLLSIRFSNFWGPVKSVAALQQKYIYICIAYVSSNLNRSTRDHKNFSENTQYQANLGGETFHLSHNEFFGDRQPKR